VIHQWDNNPEWENKRRYRPALTRPDEALEEMNRYAYVFGASNYPSMVKQWVNHHVAAHGLPALDDAAMRNMIVEIRHTAALLRDAVPFLWVEDARQAARAMTIDYRMTGDERWHSDLFTEPIMYWCYAVNLEVGALLGQYLGIGGLPPQSVEEIASIIDSRGDRIEQISILDYGGEIILPARALVGVKNEPVADHMGPSYALFEWLQSPISVTSRERVSRAARRREHLLPIREHVHVIRLRRAQSHSGDDGAAGEWSRRWIVRGHQRNQWYPSTMTHRPRWIPSYIKGPEDKPLVLPGAPVYVVKR